MLGVVSIPSIKQLPFELKGVLTDSITTRARMAIYDPVTIRFGLPTSLVVHVTTVWTLLLRVLVTGS